MGRAFAKPHVTFPVFWDSVMDSELTAIQAMVLVPLESVLASMALRLNPVTMGVGLLSLPAFADPMTSLPMEQQNEMVTIHLAQALVGLVMS